MWETQWYPCVDCSYLVDPEYPHKCGVEVRPSVSSLSPDEVAWDFELEAWMAGWRG